MQFKTRIKQVALNIPTPPPPPGGQKPKKESDNIFLLLINESSLSELDFGAK